MAPGVSPYSIPAGVPPLQMAVVGNLPAIPTEASFVPAQATEEIPIPKAESTIHTKMNNMMKFFKSWTFEMSKLNKPGYGGNQTARAYAIKADDPSPLTPKGRNYQPHRWREVRLCIYCDELGHICTFCPDVRTDQHSDIVHGNECRRLTSGRRGRNRGKISRYQEERRFLLIQKYMQEVAQQEQQRPAVATTAALLPPQPQRVARSQLFQRDSSQGKIYA